MQTEKFILADETWQVFLRYAHKNYHELVYDYWLKPIIPLAIENNLLILGAPSQLIQERVENNYLADISKVINNYLTQNSVDNFKAVKIVTMQTSAEEKDDENNEEEELYTTVNNSVDNSKVTGNNKQESTHKPESKEFSIVKDVNKLSTKYTFNRFITGNSNRFAYSASTVVAEKPGTVYNPFFIYGGVGLGKTHLMHAIGNEILKNNPQQKILYISCEKFTNDMIYYMQEKKMIQFHNKYRNVDALLIDDIQFLVNKERTQEEFFYTFNYLYEANKQIILTSDRRPSELTILEDRLRSRFAMGLHVDVQPPDLETRIAILRKKIEYENISIPDDILTYIASQVTTNIRELEGAFTTVIANASLRGIPYSIDMVMDSLKDILKNELSKPITIPIVQETIANYFKIKVDDLLCKKRTRNITYPRQIAMYLCRELTNESLPVIGQAFGGRDHSTVIHAFDKISKEKEKEIMLKNTLKEVVKLINSN